MKHFLLYIAALSFPFLILLPLPIYSLYVVGELKPFSLYIQRLEEDQLWGLAYSYYDREYKYFMTEELKPEIIELGTSRSMQVEANIFKSKYSFYNAGGAIQNPQDYLTFVKALSYNPTLIIVDINHLFFNPKSDKSPKAIYKQPKLTDIPLIYNCIQFYKDLIKGKIVLSKIHGNNNIGMLARMSGDGFTNTGFYNYGRILSNVREAEDYNFANTMSRIKGHNHRFQTCNVADLSVVGHIDAFLKECKKRGIIVISFLPPFAHAINEAMKKDGNYKYQDQIYDHLISCFDGKSQFLYDYTDVTALGGEDDYFLDGFHASVIVDNLFFKDMLIRNEILSKFLVSPEQIDSINMEYKKVLPRFHNLQTSLKKQ